MAEQEYRRTCQKCGKVWHSLMSREAKIKADQEKYKEQAFCYSATCNPDVSSQLKRNKDSMESELDRLQKCPECSSTDYKEEIV